LIVMAIAVNSINVHEKFLVTVLQGYNTVTITKS
jgi:hypothetical protein